MASRSKKKTTFAKLNREQKLRERRQEKQARKDARKQDAALHADERYEAPSGDEPVAEAAA